MFHDKNSVCTKDVIKLASAKEKKKFNALDYLLFQKIAIRKARINL